jgi:hypothetical protein
VRGWDLEFESGLLQQPEIRQFYLDRSRGLYDGREAEAGRIEADIFRAQKEHRIASNSVQPRMPDGVS